MNQNHIDYLFQVVTPRTDRGPSVARSGDSAGFNNHLSRASTGATEPARSSSGTTSGNTAPEPTTKPPLSERRTDRNDDDRSAEPPVTENRPDDDAAATTVQAGEAQAEEQDADDSDPSDEVAVTTPPAASKPTHTVPVDGEPPQPGCDLPPLAKEQSASDEKQPRATRIKAAPQASDENIEPIATEVAKDASGQVVATAGATTEAELAAEATQSAGESDQAAETGEKLKQGKLTAGSLETDPAKTTTQEVKSENGRVVGESQTGTDALPTPETVEVHQDQHEKDVEPRTLAAEPAADESRGEGKSTDHARGRTESANSGSANPVVVANNLVASLATATANADAGRESEDASPKQGGAKSAAEAGTPGRLSRGNIDIQRGSSKEAANDLPRIDPARFVGRVAKAFQTAQERGGKLQLRLSPPELGAMRIELTVKDGVMSAALETDNAAARRVLLEHLPALRERLAEQNIRVERFDVDVRRENGNGQPDPRSLNHHSQQQSPDRPEPRRPDSAHQRHESRLPQPVVAAPQISSTGINLVV